MTGHCVALLSLVVSFGLFSAALVAALGVGWGGFCAGALWALMAALLVDPEAMRR